MVKIGFYVPASHLEQVKVSMFNVGAGRIGNYDQCSWQCLGRGQFRSNEGSTPFVGSLNAVEVLEEYRVEMVCEEGLAVCVVAALKQAHPYEEPAYDVVMLMTV